MRCLLPAIGLFLPTLCLGQAPASGPDLPRELGVLNVRDFGAAGDGRTDDTAAIQAALSKGLDTHAVVYLPDGVYLVSDTLKWWRPDYALEQTQGWGAFLQMQGQSEGGTIIRLQDNCNGFGDADEPRAVIATGSRGYHGKKRYKDFEGNEAFFNNLRHFTVDVGAGNPGAIGVDYQSSNSGAMRHVTVRAAMGSGATGVSMTRRDNGPAMLADVTIEGFAVGLRMRQAIGQVVAERLTLRGQHEVGIEAGESIVSVRQVRQEGGPTAVRAGSKSLVTVLDSVLSGAIASHDEAAVLLHGVEGAVPEAYHDMGHGWRGSLAGVAAFGAAPGLPPLAAVADTPVMPLTEPSTWAVVAAPNGTDDADAIDAALGSGKPVVCFPAGKYRSTRTLTVPAHVRVVMGMGTELSGLGPLREADHGVLWHLKDGSEPVVFDRLVVSSGGASSVFVEHAAARPLVLRDIMTFRGRTIVREGAGPLFVENVAAAGYELERGATVWARQFDIEGRHAPRVAASDATIFALGFKHEGEAVVFDLKGNCNATLLGGLFYTFGNLHVPAVRIERGRLLLNAVGVTYVKNGFFDVVLDAGASGSLPSSALGARGRGVIIPAVHAVLDP